jgi:hypothetical protein
MQYNALKLIVGSQKKPIEVRQTSDSFFQTPTRVTPYIEPSFSKIEFPTQHPAILLVSAVGASGKTTTARALSFDTQLPILDLAKHKPIGDNTLTGILTTAYPIAEIGAVLQGLSTGTHGLIIDAIDEGRSKPTEQGFEAFLDDLVVRSQGAARPSIVVFGRGQVLYTTWIYLALKGANVGLIQIEPFTLEQAREYIDAHVRQTGSGQEQNYRDARDAILNKLGAAFASATADNAFLSFIGYPPVLDAIATLLDQERDYHRLQQALSSGTEGQLEIQLLIRIADYLLQRDHDEKALPNFIEDIAGDAGAPERDDLRRRLYNHEEQCARVLARALGRPFPVQVVADRALNERYEAAVATWCLDHPFLDEARLRNAVFAALAVARCSLSARPEYRSLAREYAAANRPTYHLLYILSALAADRPIDAESFNMLIQSCSEFLALNADITIDVEGESWEEAGSAQSTAAELTLSIELTEKEQDHEFSFNGRVGSERITLGPYLVNTNVTLPVAVDLCGAVVEAIGSCSIVAREMHIETSDLLLRSSPRTKEQENAGLVINVQKCDGHATAVSIRAGELVIQCVEHSLAYPLAKYVHKVTTPFAADPLMREKYRRLRRILQEFRSHKKGRLAKYRAKIEHERVLRNETGQKVLDALLNAGVLSRDTKFYYVVPEQCDAALGIGWHDLRQQKSSVKLEYFLKSIS